MTQMDVYDAIKDWIIENEEEIIWKDTMKINPGIQVEPFDEVSRDGDSIQYMARFTYLGKNGTISWWDNPTYIQKDVDYFVRSGRYESDTPIIEFES